jgi:hypothetical protein
MVGLANTGGAGDAQALMPRLLDADPSLRQAAVAIIWRLWGRSGDAAIDALYRQGPSSTIVNSGSTDLPPYMHDDWWVNKSY